MLQSETVKKYDTYKDSGIEWIGEIPQHWSTKRLKVLAKLQTGNTPPKENDINAYYADEGFLWVKPDNLSNFNPIQDTNEYLNEEGYKIARVVPAGTPLVCCIGTIGKYGVANQDVAFNQQINAVIFNNMMNNKFGLYHISCQEEQHWFYANGNVVQILNTQNQGKLLFACPPIDEQQRIADYLDKKCGEIDRVVETEKAVIEKLKEYKQSIITEAVTKGLDKSAPLKDSGIEWIGKIPQHWEVLSLARIANIVRGASPRPAGDPMYFCGDFCPWITVAEVTKNDSKYIFETEEYLTELGMQRSKLVEENTFLLSNSGATLGVPKITKIKGCINDGSLAFLNISCNMNYLYYVLKSRTNEFRKQMQGYGQPNLNTTIVKAFKICLPTDNEQEQIAEYLDNKCSEIDKAIADKEQVIEKFTEYKKSLIYECVTGKRKVAK